MSIASHRLHISEPTISLDFYMNKLGMLLIAQYKADHKQHYFLSFANKKDACLELVFDPNAVFSVTSQPSLTEGYWKFSIAVPNIIQARQCLLSQGVHIGNPFEVKNIAYLCHFTDPDGYCIELIQHSIVNNDHNDSLHDNAFRTCQPTLNLSTLRVKNIDDSISFYINLGMSLISRQAVAGSHMHLYFLTFNKESPPSADIDALIIREWLWQRPYTLLELQHTDDIASKTEFAYNTSAHSGFLGLDINNTGNLSVNLLEKGQKTTFLTHSGMVNGIILNDPDGYQLRCY